MAVAVDQHYGFKPFCRPPRCKLSSYSQVDYAMLESGQTNLTQSIKNASFEFTSLQRSLSTPCLSISTRQEEECNSNSRIEIIGGRGAPRIHALVVEVAIAMTSGVNPEPISSGLGGAYFIRARNGDIIAVAKPVDEEPLAFNNPKGFAGRMLGQPGMKRSIRIGETGHRELAAYLLDHGGFAGVPPSALVKMSHVKFNVNDPESVSAPSYKIASLQRFVEHDSDAGDLGPSGFSVSSIHRIGILDMRLLNLDRHAGNILVKKGEQERYSVGAAELVPIDHGFCLPESLDDPYFEWLHWPQASIPFSDSEIDYVANLDPLKDAELLRSELPSIRESAIRVLVLCTIFLKQAVDFGMCLAEIGEIMTREFHRGAQSWSPLENLCINARAALSIRITDDSSSSDQIEEDIDEVFKFDSDNVDCSNKVSDISDAMTGKPPKIPRFSSEKWMSKVSDIIFFPSEDEIKNQNCQYDDSNNLVEESKKEDDYDDDNNNVDGLMKSMSFSVPNHSSDNNSAGVGISFGELSNEEWESFLEIFKMLLPEFFEGRKWMCLSKQRLRNSCEF